MATTPDVRVRLSAEGVAEVVSALKKIETEGGKTAGRSRREFRGLNGVLGNTKQLLGSVGVGFTALASIRFAANQVNELKRWETSWAEVRTIISGTRAEIADTETRVRALASIIPKEHSLIASGYYQTLSSGITDSGDALNFLRSSAKAATGGITDVNTAADVGTTILNAYNEPLNQTDRIFDVLFTTVREGKVTFPELAQSIGTAVPFFAQADLEVEQLAASIATLTKGGLRAEIATTALRTMIVSLLKPQEQALALAESLGIEFNTQAVAAKGLVPWLKELQEKTGGNTDAIAKLFPEVRGLNAVLALSGKQWEEYARILDVVRNESIGASQDAFDKINETAEAQEQLLRNRLKNAWIDLGQGVLQGTKNAAAALGSLLPESFEMQAERLGGVYRQLQRIEGRGRELARVYRELERESDGSEASQQRLRRAMQELATSFPEVISEVDEFGNVLAINVENLEEYRGALRNILDLQTRDVFRSQSRNAEQLNERLTAAANKYNELADLSGDQVIFAEGPPSADETSALDNRIAQTVRTVRRRLRAEMDEMRTELESLNQEMVRTLVETGLAAEVVAFDEMIDAFESGSRPASEFKDAIAELSPQLRTLLGSTDPERMTKRLRELARLLREAAEAGATAPQADPGQSAAEIAQRQADLAIAARDREIAAAKLQGRLRSEQERREFEAGLQSARQYYADRQAIADQAFAAEIAALEAKLELTERESDAGKRLKAQATLRAQIEQRTAQYDATRAEIAEEERQAVERLGREQLGFERDLLEAQGRRHEAALAEIDEQVARYEQVLVGLGLSSDQIAAELEQYRSTFVSVADFEEAQRAAQRALQAIDLARAEIRSKVEAGLLSQVEGERQIAELEQSRIPGLRQIATSMLAAAEAIGDPDRVAEVQAFISAINQLSASGDKVRDVGDAFADLGEDMRGAGVDAFASALSGIGRQIQNLRQFLLAFIDDFGRAIQQMLARRAALKIFDWVGLKDGGEVKGYASGGLVVGPGTGRSDSIPAVGPGGLIRLSNGEMVINARQTQRPWGLEFLSRYNRGDYDPRKLLAAMHGKPFALGGLVSSGLATPSLRIGGTTDQVSSSSMPASSPASGLDGRLTIGLEDGLVARTIDSPSGDRIIVKSIARNRRRIAKLLMGG